VRVIADIVIATPAPEPAAVFLAGSGLILLGFARKRRP